MTERIELKDRELTKERRVQINPSFWVEFSALKEFNGRRVQSHIALNWAEALDIARKILELNEK